METQMHVWIYREKNVPSEPLVDWLVDQRWSRFRDHSQVLSLDNGITSLGESCDGQDPNYERSVLIVSFYCYCFLRVKYLFLWPWDHITHWHRGIPCVHQTSQRNWVTIKVLYRYLRACLLSWHGLRLGFVTPCGEVSQGPLGNIISQKACKQCD